jgi:transposase
MASYAAFLRGISAMQRSLRFSSLVPSGLSVESVTCVEETIIVKAHAQGDIAKCPLCKTASRQVHSRYSRLASDLPCAGWKVRLSLSVRRFHCEAPHCRRRIFAERFDESVLGERSRRTARLDHIVHHLGLALGGRPAASFARRLLLPVSNDTLLRVVRRRARRREEAPRVVGIDDWAFRRNHRYGTLVCDLERREVVALLPDREIPTVEAWLAAHPGIEILSRDRGGGYGEAATKALPNAVQVADRWHLMENASAAFLDAVRKTMQTIRSAIGATVVDPELLTCAERLQYQGYLRREETNAAILALSQAGVPIKRIARQTGHSRKLVRRVLRGERTDMFRVRQSTLEAYLPFLETQWAAGCHNGAELWRRSKTQGFRGSSRVVGEWAARRRRAEKASSAGLQKTPSARTVARLMTTARDHLSKAESVVVAAIEQRAPTLVEARLLIDRFQEMIRKKAGGELDPWVADARQSLVASFARGIVNDLAAVRAAIASPWSNGQTEGQITKLKLVKRQMYGRAKVDLLEARLLGAA